MNKEAELEQKDKRSYIKPSPDLPVITESEDEIEDTADDTNLSPVAEVTNKLKGI